MTLKWRDWTHYAACNRVNEGAAPLYQAFIAARETAEPGSFEEWYINSGLEWSQAEIKAGQAAWDARNG